MIKMIKMIKYDKVIKMIKTTQAPMTMIKTIGMKKIDTHGVNNRTSRKALVRLVVK